MYLRAPSYLKWSYVLVVLSAVLPIGLASSGWVAFESLRESRRPFDLSQAVAACSV